MKKKYRNTVSAKKNTFPFWMHSKFITVNLTILGPAFSSVSSIPNFQHWPLARNSVPLKSGRRRCSRHRRRRRRRRRQPPPYFSPHSLLVSSVFRQVVVVLGRKKEKHWPLYYLWKPGGSFNYSQIHPKCKFPLGPELKRPARVFIISTC